TSIQKLLFGRLGLLQRRFENRQRVGVTFCSRESDRETVSDLWNRESTPCFFQGANCAIVLFQLEFDPGGVKVVLRLVGSEQEGLFVIGKRSHLVSSFFVQTCQEFVDLE